jgi:hypothetical protein
MTAATSPTGARRPRQARNVPPPRCFATTGAACGAIHILPIAARSDEDRQPRDAGLPRLPVCGSEAERAADADHRGRGARGRCRLSPCCRCLEIDRGDAEVRMAELPWMTTSGTPSRRFSPLSTPYCANAPWASKPSSWLIRRFAMALQSPVVSRSIAMKLRIRRSFRLDAVAAADARETCKGREGTVRASAGIAPASVFEAGARPPHGGRCAIGCRPPRASAG